MYLDALSFLEDERDAFRPFEALADLDDAALSVPVSAAHGWSGRDLMVHITGWLEHALAVARDLALGETSATKRQRDADLEARGLDAFNADMVQASAGLPMAEVRRRFNTVPGELRGYLTVVPEARWIKSAEYEQVFLEETLDHYAEHGDDLEAILRAVGGDARSGSVPA